MLKADCFVLYRKISPQLAEAYSRQKFGDLQMTAKFGKQLADLINKKILSPAAPGRPKYIVFTTNKYPLNKYCKKNSLLLAEEVAKCLKKDLAVGQYKYIFNKAHFYDSQKDRRGAIHKPFLDFKTKAALKRQNYHALIIDDSIFSGNTFKESLILLNGLVKHASCISIVSLKGKKYSEKDINDYIYIKKGFPFLLLTVEQRGYIFTSNMLRTINELSASEKKMIVKAMNIGLRKKFFKAFRIYFDAPFH